jgi:putative oxidoreductase
VVPIHKFVTSIIIEGAVIMSTNSTTRSPAAQPGQRDVSNATASTLYDWATLIGRIGLAALFLWSGYGKLVHMDGNVGYMKAFGLPAAELLIWPALLVELGAGAMLLVGWKARWAAIVLVLYTLPATFIFHAYWSVPADQVLNMQIHFMKNLAIVGGLLGIFAHGSGPLALDRR